MAYQDKIIGIGNGLEFCENLTHCFPIFPITSPWKKTFIRGNQKETLGRNGLKKFCKSSSKLFQNLDKSVFYAK